MSEVKTCERCGEEFSRRDNEKPGRWKKRLYCSRRCGGFVPGYQKTPEHIENHAMAIRGRTASEETKMKLSIAHKERSKTVEQSFMEHIEKTEYCWNWTGAINGGGYGNIVRRTKYPEALEKTYLTHRVSYELFIESIPEGLHVLHKCDNRRCVNPDHLFIGTNTDNVNDKVEKGRQWKILTNDQVDEIRRLYSEGVVTQYALADEYGVTQSNISFIVTQKRRVHG